MAEESFQEKTEEATPKRQEMAREEGQVAKSLELNAAAIIGLGLTATALLAPFVAQQSSNFMRHTFTNAATLFRSDADIASLSIDSLLSFLTQATPFMGILLVIGVVASISQVGFHVSPKALTPKFERINPLAGMKRLFSPRSLVVLVRDLIKLFIVGYVAWSVISKQVAQMVTMVDLSVSQLGPLMSEMALALAIKIGLAIFAIALLDYMYTRFEFAKSIRMSKQDVKDEYKNSDGSPQIKSRIRQIQRDQSRSRMMADIPKADVVITNPTHIAVAIKYDADTMGAPTVLAKGERLIAQRIKEIAREHGIPIIEDKPLARALFKLCDVGASVPQTLYRAVAEILAYVYRLDQRGVKS